MHKSIIIDHLCRVEGHGGITVNIKDGKVTEVNMDIFEGPRFFETLVLGRAYDEVTPILMRICAICSAVHTVTSLMAIENRRPIPVVSPRERFMTGLPPLPSLVRPAADSHLVPLC